VQAVERQLVVILADISGYTRFMLENQTAAVHGQMCITGLIETLLREVDIPLQLQEIEGDALFLYAAHPGDETGWQDVLAQVRTKLPRFFRVFLQAMVPGTEATPCGCAICRNLKELKLKVIVHVGRAVFHEIARKPQVSGADVILAHRLLKNSQPNREYLLMTEAAHRALGREMEAAFEECFESYEGFGRVRTYVQRLDDVAEREREAFYALPPGAFRFRLLRSYALRGCLEMFRAFTDQVRRPTVAVGWPKRVLFALRMVVEMPLMLLYLTLVRPGQLRARHEAERLREAASR
jgi:class 3 adenylate cyclase